LPYENLVFGGGGSKCAAYLGAIKVLDDAGCLAECKRFAGSSAGALVAFACALGLDFGRIEELIGSIDFADTVRDPAYGTMHKLVKRYIGTKNHYGIHSGKWMVELCRYVCFEVTGNADLTFRQLHAFNGRELCITASNVSCMAEEYFHVKTAPDMCIKDAVRMSVALPVLVQPVDYKGSIYVDGGLLCNYPVHAFDGWWLSLEPDKSRLSRLSKLDEASSFSIHSNKFGTHPNEKTLGFTIFSSNEPNRTEHWVCDGGGHPTQSPTPSSA
jgi:predicted acylesterase/phospholipase RssA